MRRAVVLTLVLALAGCGGTVKRAQPKPPRLPRDLAQAWAQQADQVAAALAAGDGCTAQQIAVSMHAQFVSAVNGRRVPQRLQEPLGSALNDLQSRTTCTPPPQQPPGSGGGDQQGNGNGNGHGDGGGD
jgi:hypothetical protein